MLFALVVSLSLAAAPPTKSHAAEVLRTQCLLWAADPKNPWALAHGMTALGPKYLASDGRTAASVIIGDFLLENRLPDGGLGQGSPLGFARSSTAGTPIEPHTNLLSKTLIAEAQLPLSSSFAASFGKVTLAQLLASTKEGFRHVPASPEYWRDVGWTLSLFAATHQPGDRWKTSTGWAYSMDEIFDDALTELELETKELADGLSRHLPQVPKRKQGLYAHSCGGLHFVQGTLAWARHPAVRKRWGARLDSQIAIHFYRLESERQQYDAAYQQALSSMPQYKLPVLVQMLKFYGHWLETVMHFKRELGWSPSPAQRQAIATAKALLDQAVRGLEENKAFAQLEALKSSQPQLALDLIGDSCHAAHALSAL